MSEQEATAIANALRQMIAPAEGIRAVPVKPHAKQYAVIGPFGQLNHTWQYLDLRLSLLAQHLTELLGGKSQILTAASLADVER